MKNIIVIGCGGIGYHLAPTLVRFLEYSEVPSTVYFVDRDSIEEKNLARQYGPKSVGLGKAKALVNLLTDQLQPKNVVLKSVPEVFSPRTLRTAKNWYWTTESDVFVGVDNHATRLFVQEEALKLRDVAVFTGGNEYHDGQCQVFIRRDGKNLTPPINDVHPEMATSQGKFPDDPSCMVEAESQPQLVLANMLAATSMLCAWWSLHWRTQAQPTVNEILFDATGPSMKPVWSRSLKKEKV